MKLTQGMLRRIVNEEYSRATRGPKRALREGNNWHGGDDLYELDPTDLMEFAKLYRNLGDAVAEQLHAILEEGPDADVNPNAVDMIKEALGGANQEIDTSIEEWEDAYNGTDPDDDDEGGETEAEPVGDTTDYAKYRSRR